MSGHVYDTTLVCETVRLGGTVSRWNVSPQGFQPAGTELHIDGTGFTPSTQIRCDGAPSEH